MPKPSHNHSTQEEVVETLEVAAEKAGRYARKLLDQTPSVGAGAESLTAAVREEPIKASLVALGIGLICGLLLNRR